MAPDNVIPPMAKGTCTALQSPEVSKLVAVGIRVCALCDNSVCSQHFPVFPGISPAPTQVLINCCFQIPVALLH